MVAVYLLKNVMIDWDAMLRPIAIVAFVNQKLAKVSDVTFDAKNFNSLL